MAKIVVIAGLTSTGKSTSYCPIDLEDIKIKGIDPKKTFMFNIADKEIPVKAGNKLYASLGVEGGNNNMLVGFNYPSIFEMLNKINSGKRFENILIEDAQYLLSMDFFTRRNQPGYDKYAKMGFSFIELINYIKSMRDDITVFFIMHTDEIVDEKNVVIKLKTVGKMLDEKFTLEGLFSIVLRSVKVMKNKKVTYQFLVKPESINDIVKTPLGMFVDDKGMSLSSIPNDLGLVKEALDKYY